MARVCVQRSGSLCSRVIVGAALCVAALFLASLSAAGPRRFQHQTTGGTKTRASVRTTSASSVTTSSLLPTTASAIASNWRQLGTTTLSERQHAGVAFNAANSQLVVFGGDNSVGVLNDTWSFDGTRWNRLQPPQSPPARTSAAM